MIVINFLIKGLSFTSSISSMSGNMFGCIVTENCNNIHRYERTSTVQVLLHRYSTICWWVLESIWKPLKANFHWIGCHWMPLKIIDQIVQCAYALIHAQTEMMLLVNWFLLLELLLLLLRQYVGPSFRPIIRLLSMWQPEWAFSKITFDVYILMNQSFDISCGNGKFSFAINARLSLERWQKWKSNIFYYLWKKTHWIFRWKNFNGIISFLSTVRNQFRHKAHAFRWLYNFFYFVFNLSLTLEANMSGNNIETKFSIIASHHSNQKYNFLLLCLAVLERMCVQRCFIDLNWRSNRSGKSNANSIRIKQMIDALIYRRFSRDRDESQKKKKNLITFLNEKHLCK